MGLMELILNKVPHKFKRKIMNLFTNFVDGFQIIADPKKFFYAFALSFIIWILSGLSIFSLFYFQNLELPLVCAYVVLVVTILGVSLPAAPGMMGNFQWSCIVALTFFNIQKNDAFLFSMVNYFIGIGLIIILGLVCLPAINISFKEIKQSISGKDYS